MKLKIISDKCGDPYLARLEIFNIFGWVLMLHIFIRGDVDEELHDHPWNFLSFVLVGGYLEHGQSTDGRDTLKYRRPWTLAYRRAEHRHKVQLLTHHEPVVMKDGSWKSYVTEVPCATLVLHGPKRREWGFWRKLPIPEIKWEDLTKPCPLAPPPMKEFIPWREFVSKRDCD